MLVVKIGEDITVGRGLRRSCGGDQATQNIFRDGALAMTLRERVPQGLCHGAGHRRAFDRGQFGCQAVSFWVFDVEHENNSRSRNQIVYRLSTGMGGGGSCSLPFLGE